MGTAETATGGRAIPAGFEPMPQVSPALDTVGPIYMQGAGESRRFGMLVLRKHCNVQHKVHGGLLAALADVALGFTLGYLAQPVSGYVTVSLNIDYAGNAGEGDWLEASTDIQRRGRRLAFANCYIWRGDTRIVRASGVFMATGKPVPDA